MTKEEKAKIYNRKIQQLIVDIDEIIKSSLQKAEQSDKIMARLREEYVFVKNSYINKFGNASFVTIDPYSDYIKPDLEEDNIEGIGDDEYCRIPAYSFGPFDSKVYFDNDTFKIFWLIKEPFCENRNELVEAYYKNDSDYYNQPKWYATWDSLEYNTHINAVKISQIILTQLTDIKLDNITNERVRNSLSKLKKEDLTDMDQVMKHICFIEVNHFPGFALNPNNKKKSKDDLIGKWANINKQLIVRLIEFYNPDVIMGGFDTLSALCIGSEMAKMHLFNYLKANSSQQLKATDGSGYPEATMLNSEIKDSDNSSIKYATQKGEQKSRLVSMVQDNNNRNWFACPHPGDGIYKNKQFKQEFAKWIIGKLKRTGL